MSLVATELAGRRTELNAENKVVGRRSFSIVSTTRLTGFETVSGLPALGDEWPDQSMLIAQSVVATEAEQLTAGGWQWVVEVEYRNWFDDDGISGVGAHPLDREARWTWDSENFTETRFEDLDGKSYLNTAGDPIDPPPTFDVSHVIATVTKAYTSFDGGTATTYVNSINHASFAGGDRGTIKIDRISVLPKILESRSYYDATFTLHYNPRGWDPHYELNQGPRYLKLTNGVWKRVYCDDDNGVVSTGPVLLDEIGQKAIFDPDHPNDPYYNDEPTYLTFRQYDYQNFSALNLL